MTLAEKGLDWTEREVDLFKLEQYDPKYLAFNPKGVVPTLVHDGMQVIESTLICEYLDDVFPDPPLRPSAPGNSRRCGSGPRRWTRGCTPGSPRSALRHVPRAHAVDDRRAARPALAQYRRSGAQRPRPLGLRARRWDSPHVYNAIAAYESRSRSWKRPSRTGGAGSWAMPSPSPTSCSPPTWRGSTTSPCSTCGPRNGGVAAWWERHGTPSSAQLSGRLTPEMVGPMNRFGAAIRPRVAERREEYLAELAAARAAA